MMKRFLTLLSLIGSTYLIGQIPTDYVAYYPFNGNADDESGNGYNGTVVGAISTTGHLGDANSAYSFDRVNDYIDFPNGSLINSGSITISTWVYWDGNSSDYRNIISRWNQTSSQRSWSLLIDKTTGKIRWWTSTSNGYVLTLSTSAIPANEWVHVTVTYSSGSQKAYTNGILSGNNSNQSGNLVSSTQEIEIGYRQDEGLHPYGGKIDEVKIFTRELSSSEILALFNDIGPPPVGPSLWTANGSNIYYNSGNVGIGTTNPLSLLSVDGLIRAEEIKVVTDVDVPDYVFEPGYPLRSLDDLRSYIHDEGHLPDIPSAAEIQLANGFELGDMDMRLLRKIEELTLYTIEQENKINNQNKMIEKITLNDTEQEKSIEELRQQINHLKEILSKLVNDL